MMAMRGRGLALAMTSASFFATALVVPSPSATGSNCQTFHGRGHLTGFAGGLDAGSLFYSAEEGSTATATVSVTAGDCQGGSFRVSYVTEDGRAKVGEDYTATTGQTGPLCQDLHPQFCDGTPAEEQVVVSTVEDDPSQTESAVESFVFRLTSGTAGLLNPSTAPIHVIDDDGATRASLEPTVDGTAAVAYSRSESFSRILIPVFLAGPSASGSVGFTVTSDPQSPATSGEDFQVVQNPVVITGHLGFIQIEIVNDKLAESSEAVVITLTGAVDGPASTTFTILDNEENEPPRSRLHHPRHKWKYKKSDYRIREVHVFTSDTGGSGVTAAQFALRRNRKNGDCQWLTKEGWQKKECTNRQWLETRYDQAGLLWYYRLKQLKSSVGKARIKDYTAFSRAIDGAGNVEKEFNQKRNDNTFEVKRRRKR
jgi:hypothetical protein